MVCNKSPIVVACGVGVDSVAMLIEMERRYLRPDLILFADTGSEKAETYLYVPILRQWLRDVDFPQLEVVRYRPVTAPYDSLYGNCEANHTLPGLAFGIKSCSIKWKRDPQDRYVKHWRPALDCWDAGGQVVKLIGFDASDRDRRRATFAAGESDDRYIYGYPLINWNIDREAAKRIISDAGLPVPVKSACFMCPAMKQHEIHSLRENSAEQYQLAIDLEATYRNGRHYRPEGTQGLGRRFAWADLEQT